MSLRKLELLAPAGRIEALHSVVEAGADAVYLGGKRFNMRALKTDFNFADEEIAEAVQFLHQHHRKLYITVNNLYNGEEIDDIADYLLFLQGLGVDALIVQDLGIINLCQEMQLKLPLHASVQMGIANLEAVKILEEKGFQRVILSKNLGLDEIRAISTGSSLGIEFFIHGDLCISHAGQCYMSSFIAGESGNRGRCRKPCRWPYEYWPIMISASILICHNWLQPASALLKSRAGCAVLSTWPIW
jgi:U32 family peptidase